MPRTREQADHDDKHILLNEKPEDVSRVTAVVAYNHIGKSFPLKTRKEIQEKFHLTKLFRYQYREFESNSRIYCENGEYKLTNIRQHTYKTKSRFWLQKCLKYVAMFIQRVNPMNETVLQRIMYTVQHHENEFKDDDEFLDYVCCKVKEKDIETAIAQGKFVISKWTAKRLLDGEGYHPLIINYTERPRIATLIPHITIFQNAVLNAFLNCEKCQVFNMDQCSIPVNYGAKFGRVRDADKYAAEVRANKKETVTLVCVGSDTGEMLETTVIDHGALSDPVRFNVTAVLEKFDKFLTDRKQPNFKNLRRTALNDKRTVVQIPKPTDANTNNSPPVQDLKTNWSGWCDAQMTSTGTLLKTKMLDRDEEWRKSNTGDLYKDTTEHTIQAFAAVKDNELKALDASAIMSEISTFYKALESHQELLNLLAPKPSGDDAMTIAPAASQGARATVDMQDADSAHFQARRDYYKNKIDDAIQLFGKRENPKLVEEVHDHVRKTCIDHTLEVLESKEHVAKKMAIIAEVASHKKICVEGSDGNRKAYDAICRERAKAITDSGKDLVNADSFIYMTQKSAYVDSDNFVKWLHMVIVPHLKEGVTTFLMLDHYKCHFNERAMKAMRDVGIIPVYVPKNSTGLVQPLDVAVMKHIKAIFRNIATDYNMRLLLSLANGKQLPTISQSTRNIMTVAQALQNIKRTPFINGFRRGLTYDWSNTIKC